MTHTSGPWEFDENSGQLYVNDERDRTLIATVNYGEGIINTDEAVANGNLLAAALKLLAACKAARRIIISAVTLSVDIPDFDPAGHTVVRQLDAAIAKAEAM